MTLRLSNHLRSGTVGPERHWLQQGVTKVVVEMNFVGPAHWLRMDRLGRGYGGLQMFERTELLPETRRIAR